MQGEVVEFDLEFRNGAVDRPQCRADLPKIIHALKQFAEMAEELGLKGVASTNEVVSPYFHEDVKVGRNLDGSLVVLGIRTTHSAHRLYVS